jgi:hypothetical protein
MLPPINHLSSNAGMLFNNATEMCRAISAPQDSPVHQREALASILLAFFSTEAFINELGQLAEFVARDRADLPGWIATLASILEEAENSRSPIESKYVLAHFILTGRPFDRAAQPFQDFALLTDVRNVLVHRKPLDARLEKDESGVYKWSEPKLMRQLQSAKIIQATDSLRKAAERNKADTLIADAVGQVSTQAVAAWACRTAAAIVNAIIDGIPSGSFRALVETMYRMYFRSESSSPV